MGTDKSKKTAPTLHVRISKATETIWEGEATSVSSNNGKGPFDILPMHANFITLLKSEPIIVIEGDGKKTNYTFKQSVLYVTNNTIRVFADIV